MVQRNILKPTVEKYHVGLRAQVAQPYCKKDHMLSILKTNT